MKVEALFLLFLGVFFGLVGLVYWFTSYDDGGGMMLLGNLAARLPPRAVLLLLAQAVRGKKFFFWGKEHGAGDRPSDRPDATLDEGAGEIESFPGSSIWPFVLGMGAFLTLVSLVFGIWLIFPGIALILSAAVGVTAESRRGGHV